MKEHRILGAVGSCLVLVVPRFIKLTEDIHKITGCVDTRFYCVEVTSVHNLCGSGTTGSFDGRVEGQFRLSAESSRRNSHST